MPSPLLLDQALARVLGLVEPLELLDEPLERCEGRVLGATVLADADTPGFDSSAMDGYAVRHADLDHLPVRLDVVTTSSAGHPAERGIGPGQAARILTGAAMVTGADTVVRVERTDGGLDRVRIDDRPPPGADVRRRGEVARRGDVVLERGTVLNPAHLGIAAGIGRATLTVPARPRLAVVSTGDELIGTGTPGPGQIHESNGALICAMARRRGCEVSAHHVGDDPDALRDLLDRVAATHDLLVTTGGISMGAEFDVVRAAVSGLDVRVCTVAIAPGKPLAFGRVGRTPLIGLPGNPVAAAVSFRLFAVPALARMSGASGELTTRRGVLGAPMSRRDDGRTHLVRVRQLDDGRWAPTTSGGTHVLAGVAEASALALVGPEQLELGVGETLQLVELWD